MNKKTISVVAAVIRDGERVFATQRGYGEFKDGWEFPGGKIEPGETTEEALVREIREELDTEISVRNPVWRPGAERSGGCKMADQGDAGQRGLAAGGYHFD